MFRSKLFSKNKRTIFTYSENEISKIEDIYLKSKSPAVSPIISSTLKDIRKYKEGDLSAQKHLELAGVQPENYLKDLAKANIFITQNVKCPDNITKELLIEVAFASYQFQKDNNLPMGSFDKFFSKDSTSPFGSFNKIKYSSLMCGSGDGLSKSSYMYLNPDLDPIQKSTSTDNSSKTSSKKVKNPYLSLMKTLTHEFQHMISHYGIYEGLSYNSAREGLNEMCTESLAMQIIEKYLDQDIMQKTKVNLLLDDETSKTMTMESKAKTYIETATLFDTIDTICEGKLAKIYYSRDKLSNNEIVNIENSLSAESKKYLPEMYEAVDKSYIGLCKGVKNYSYNNHTYYEKRFDEAIDSVSKLVTHYLKDTIGLTKDTNPTTKEGASIYKKANQFLKTLDELEFIKEGEQIPQGVLIGERALGSLQKMEYSMEQAKERFENHNTYFRTFLDKNDDANKTLGERLSQKVGIEWEKDLKNDKSNDKTKEISKEKENITDLEL